MLPSKPPSPLPDQADLQRRIGATLRLHRHQAGWSQERLASRARISRTYLADIERGARHPLLSTIGRFAAALGVSLAVFFATFETIDTAENEVTTSKPEKLRS